MEVQYLDHGFYSFSAAKTLHSDPTVLKLGIFVVSRTQGKDTNAPMPSHQPDQIALPPARAGGMSDSFVYEPLDLKQKSIRVLTILSTSTKTAIRCELRRVPLRRSHVCLSYTWGNDADHRYIEVNGKGLRVRPNLYTFLLRARRDFKSKELWIDAVCIDQKNVKEKNAQVQMMAEIYRSAKEVLIWAGNVGSRLR
jgi:hypothetical protein